MYKVSIISIIIIAMLELCLIVMVSSIVLTVRQSILFLWPFFPKLKDLIQTAGHLNSIANLCTPLFMLSYIILAGSDFLIVSSSVFVPIASPTVCLSS